MKWMASDGGVAVFIALSVIGVYIALITLTRLFGVRSFSKMSGFDFAVTVAIGSVIGATVAAPSPPLLNGALALAFLFCVQMGVAAMRVRSPKLMSLIDNSPRLIMAGRETAPEQMRKAKITEDDLRAKLREANVLDYDQVEAVIAETTGDISVLHRSEGAPRLNPELLQGVIGADALRSKH